MNRTTTRAQRRSIASVAGILLLVYAIPARAQELGPSPWLPMVAPDKGAQETFELNTLGIIRAGEAGWRVFRGRHRESVSRHDFFVTVGRQDLGRQESSRQATHDVLMWGGYGLALGGVVLMYAHVSEGGFDPPLAVGGGLVAGGLISVWISSLFSGPAISGTEAENLVQRYNQRLGQHLQDTPRRSTGVVARTSPWRLLPWASPSSAGLVAAATF